MLLTSALFGYIDPMSGSIVLQVIIAGVIGGLAFFRRSWLRLLAVVTGGSAATHSQTAAPAQRAQPPDHGVSIPHEKKKAA